MISTFTAVIDANVFYGARLRSLILYLALTGLFRARWTNTIHEEWISNLLSQRKYLRRSDLDRVRSLMNSAVEDCLITNYEGLTASLTLPDPDDRHVLAAAIRGRANVIVTFNERDFPVDVLAIYGIHTRHPDDFILDLFGVDEVACMAAVQADVSHYLAPPLSLEDYLAGLELAGIGRTATYLRERKIILV